MMALEKIHSLLCDALYIGPKVYEDENDAHESVKYIADILFDIDIDKTPLEYIEIYEIDFTAEDVENLIANMKEIKSPSKALSDIYNTIKIILSI